MFSWISFSRRWEFPQILQRVFWRQNRLAWPLEHLYWAFRALNWLQNARLGWYSVWQCIGGWETTRSEAGSLLWTHPSLSLSPFQKRRGVSPWIVRVPIRSPSSSWKGRSACCSISLFTQTLSSDPEEPWTDCFFVLPVSDPGYFLNLGIIAANHLIYLIYGQFKRHQSRVPNYQSRDHRVSSFDTVWEKLPQKIWKNPK